MHTYLPYKRDCEKCLSPRIGHIRMTMLTASHVAQLYAELAEAGVSAAMIRKAGTTLHAALQYAVHPLKLIPFNPATGVTKPKHEPAEMQVLDPDQVAAFLEEAKTDRLFALYAVALDSGGREGELLALTWPDVDFDGKAIRITKTLEETAGVCKLKEVKTTPINTSCRACRNGPPLNWKRSSASRRK